jgi:putative copper export protein
LSHSLLAGSFFLHLAATVVWIGGMALLVLVIYPLQRRVNDDPARLLDAIEARFRPLANFSLLVLLVTGVFQTGNDEFYGGLFNFDNDWSRAMLGKHIAFAGMVLIVGFLQFRHWNAPESSPAAIPAI